MIDRFRAGKRLWNAEDDAALRNRYPHEPTRTLARDLRRSDASISGRAKLLGLRKCAVYLASPAACRLRRGDHVGARFRFLKGHIPANKGLRRPGWNAGRMRDTQFKPGMRSGQAAAHYMPVGSTRLIDGYVYRKITDTPNVPYTVNWMPEHHLVWVAAHGALPPGHVLMFRNGDPMDIRLDNLDCVSRRTLMARNSVHNLPPALAQTIQLLGALHRRIRRSGDDAQQQD